MIINMHQKYYLVLYQINNLGKELNISPHIFTMMNTVNTEFSSVEVGLLEIED